FYLGAQGSLGNVDVQVQQDVVLLAVEEFVVPYIECHIQVALRPAVHPRLPLAIEAHLVAAVRARRDPDLAGRLLALHPRAVAHAAGLIKQPAAAAAIRAGSHLDPIAQPGGTRPAHLTWPTTGGAGVLLAAALSAVAVATVAGLAP